MTLHSPDFGQPPRRAARVVIAAHAGDEARGCGGLLARYPDESAVVLLPGLGEEGARQFAKAQEALGYSQTFRFDLPAGRIGDDMDLLVRMLGDILARTRPVELYVPFPSVDHDGVAAFAACVRLARPAADDNRWVPPLIMLYQCAKGAMPADAAVVWNIGEALTRTNLERRNDAVRAYGSGRSALSWTERFAFVGIGNSEGARAQLLRVGAVS